MKIILTCIFFGISFFVTGQTQLPLENYPNGGNPDGIYFRDTNGVLDAYTGTWQWTDGNKELNIYLYKDEQVTFVNPIRGTYDLDVVFGYYVYKESGNVLIDTKPILISNINDRDSIDRGGIGMLATTDGLNLQSLPALYFVDHSRRTCVEGVQRPVSGDPGLWRFINTTTADIGLFTSGTRFSTCGTIILHAGFPSNQGIRITKMSNTAPPLN